MSLPPSDQSDSENDRLRVALRYIDSRLRDVYNQDGITDEMEVVDEAIGDVFLALGMVHELYRVPSDRSSDPKAPPRETLSPEVDAAARTISRDVWGHPYRPGEGVMHFAGGSYWHDELLRLADKWERMAKAARVCAEALPDA